MNDLTEKFNPNYKALMLNKLQICCSDFFFSIRKKNPPEPYLIILLVFKLPVD